MWCRLRALPLVPARRSASLMALLAIGGCLGEPADPNRGIGALPPGVPTVGAGTSAGSAVAGAGGPVAPSGVTGPACTTSRAPLRRLTRFEYDNTVRDLLGDTTSPARSLPSEELGNGFGNDADTQS